MLDSTTQYFECVESGDPNTIAQLLQYHPYHVDALVQLAEVHGIKLFHISTSGAESSIIVGVQAYRRTRNGDRICRAGHLLF